MASGGDKKAILLRIPADMWEHLNRWARDDLRSLNAQIEFLLREALRRRLGRRAAQDGNPRETPPTDGSSEDSPTS
ncbi:MAG: hypothetical protein HUU22_06800 [Phycisphaerae bacterium]|nr:hypothetical protein [Phycisphaerae bacterium]NUQ45723.1 hypothetical protein [Phycisphaerae bacterium]